METNRELFVQALRNLVGEIHVECKGAYGDEDGYEGQYEAAIQKLADIVFPYNAGEGD